jgi:hypothetical protein
MLEWIILILNVIIILLLILPLFASKKSPSTRLSNEGYSIFTDMIDNISRTIQAEDTPSMLAGFSSEDEKNICDDISKIALKLGCK